MTRKSNVKALLAPVVSDDSLSQSCVDSTTSNRNDEGEFDVNPPDKVADKGTLRIAHDGEWDGKTQKLRPEDKNGYKLSISFATSNGLRFMFIADTFPPDTLESMIDHCKRNLVITRVVRFTDETDFLAEVLETADPMKEYKTVSLLLYYSAKDLELALGWSQVSEFYQSESIIQKRNISTPQPLSYNGRKLIIKDLFGWSPQGLKALGESVGLNMNTKKLLDGYKTSMKDGGVQMPETFVEYAMGDVDELLIIHTKFIELIRWVQGEVIGIPHEDLFTETDIPMTLGALVAATLDKFIHAQAVNKNHLKFAMRKLGKLDTSVDNDKYQIALRCHDLMQKIRSRGDIDKALAASKNFTITQFLTRSRYAFTAISQASVGCFARDTSGTVAFNALVQGGRCNNERPTEYSAELGADIDLKSCYGTALRQNIFPIGLPRVWGHADEQVNLSLKSWLKKYEKQLVDGLWTATISVKLTFRQDLIYSKVVTKEEINRAAFGDMDKECEDPDRDDDLSHIPGTFMLTRKEIENGIITSDILEALRKVCTNQELSEIMDAPLVTVVAYLKTDEVDDIETWQDTVIADKGGKTFVNHQAELVKDTRTRAWYGMPLESFIGKLVETRNQLKKSAKSLCGEDKAQAGSKQQVLKLFINTTYGVICSPYFSVGNTVIANNITAKARLGAWMINKPLHTRMSITDGGFYSFMSVAFLGENAKLPGLAALSDNTLWKTQFRNDRYCDTLGGLDWAKILEDTTAKLANATPSEIGSIWGELGNLLDCEAMKHINTFWARYGLKLPFDIEHKAANTFYKSSYWSKAHYQLECLDGRKEVKIRGAKNYSDEDELRKSPVYKLLEAIVQGTNIFPNELGHDHKSLLKIGKWLLAFKSKNPESFKGCKDKRPGDEVIEPRVGRFNNQHMFADTVKEYLSRATRKTYHRGEPQKFFERYVDFGIEKVHHLMLDNNLNWKKNSD